MTRRIDTVFLIARGREGGGILNIQMITFDRLLRNIVDRYQLAAAGKRKIAAALNGNIIAAFRFDSTAGGDCERIPHSKAFTFARCRDGDGILYVERSGAADRYAVCVQRQLALAADRQRSPGSNRFVSLNDVIFAHNGQENTVNGSKAFNFNTIQR